LSVQLLLYPSVKTLLVAKSMLQNPLVANDKFYYSPNVG
jgi:hypothetical protein